MPDKKHAPDPSFVHELRMALHHLYDWVWLRQSPLTRALGLEQEDDPTAALRSALVEAVEALKPGGDVPSRARPWRTYHVLSSRYREQFSQRETAGELGLSIRHLRREETAALETLAAYLWHRFEPAQRWQARSAASEPVWEPADADTQTPTREQELAWLQQSLPSEPVEAGELLRPVLELLKPLAQPASVQVECAIPEGLPPLVVQLTPVRQALLAALTAAIRAAPGGRVAVEAQAQGAQVHLWARIYGRNGVPDLHPDDAEGLRAAHQLVVLSGGALSIASGDAERKCAGIEMAFPAQAQVPVLVVDDNADTLRLLERYLSGTRYQFAGTGDPGQALALAQEVGAEIIVLDVMLPEVDGWELLGRLRQHPQVGRVPVIVCSILPHEELASRLGASGYIRKPVTRGAFLSALDRCCPSLSSAPRQ